MQTIASAHADFKSCLRGSFMGAIARSRDCQLVTRDVAPFERMGCKVLNPWILNS
jgi:predicted nucleic acid-binding protein